MNSIWPVIEERKEIMATKAQEDAKKKAAKIAEEAKAAKTTRKRAPKAVEAKVEEVKAEEKVEGPVETEEEKLSKMNNTSDEKKEEVTADSAKAFQEKADEEDAFLRRTIHLPSRRAIRKAFEQEEIIGDEFDEIVTEGKQRELEYQVLSDSAKAKKPKRLLGRVVGIEPVYGSDNKLLTYNAKVSLIMNPQDPQIKALIKEKKEPKSIYSVYIPAPVFFFQRRPELFAGEEGMRNLSRAMKNKINALVEFVVYDISPDDKRVIGSRIRAMQLKAYDYFLNPRGRRAKVGDKCAARITEVGVKGITVEVCGAETFIPNDDLSWLHINNAKKEYKVGQTIAVIVKSIEIGRIEANGRSTQYVAVTASAKEATKKPMEAHGDEYQLNAQYPGILEYRLPSGKYIVRIDNKVEAICYPPDFGTPTIGGECSVFLKDKNDIGFTGNLSYFT